VADQPPPDEPLQDERLVDEPFAESTAVVAVGPVRIPVGLWVYGTVTLLSVLVVFEGWQDLRGPFAVVLVTVGPAIALMLAHLFGEALDEHIRLHRPLRRHEWREAVVDSAVFLLMVVPLLAVLLVGQVLRLDLGVTVRLMLWLGVLSLGFWGWLAGRHAGLRGWRLVGSAVAGLVIGLVVISLQLILKPH
jgi:hypothetical protein